ncbi:type II secretion system minor pseudopilin GspI [uncultured Tateyamaria sp.]|uniref:type II secretion system minor pseudopilin GspI n=1 Tax=uncultured Tateyamaria sp. TaxID=455651 RepID=UPI00260B6CB0|nr:type II secretion system minor pseudopilin GspI [uncultured Tateyamaria sp.]
MNMRAAKTDGFSLIETLVAMTVLAVSSSVILSATEAHTRAVTAVTDRTIARWVAQNAMVQLEAGREMSGTVRMGGTEWEVRVDQSATPDPDLERVDILVATTVTRDVVLARLTGFIDTASGAVE